MNLSHHLKTAVANRAELAPLLVISDGEWHLIHAIFEWLLVGFTLTECRAKLQAHLDDPRDVAQRPAVRAVFVALRTHLADAAIRTALQDVFAVYRARRADFRAARAAEGSVEVAPVRLVR